MQISHDKSEYVFQFERPYELYDDVEALKRCGLTDGLDIQATVGKLTLLSAYLTRTKLKTIPFSNLSLLSFSKSIGVSGRVSRSTCRPH